MKYLYTTKYKNKFPSQSMGSHKVQTYLEWSTSTTKYNCTTYKSTKYKYSKSKVLPPTHITLL
jgi:hypothetical protein